RSNQALDDRVRLRTRHGRSQYFDSQSSDRISTTFQKPTTTSAVVDRLRFGVRCEPPIRLRPECPLHADGKAKNPDNTIGGPLQKNSVAVPRPFRASCHATVRL